VYQALVLSGLWRTFLLAGIKGGADKTSRRYRVAACGRSANSAFQPRVTHKFQLQHMLLLPPHGNTCSGLTVRLRPGKCKTCANAASAAAAAAAVPICMQTRWYSFQFLLDELVEEMDNLYCLVQKVLSSLPHGL
jgi:hypothetical protein